MIVVGIHHKYNTKFEVLCMKRLLAFASCIECFHHIGSFNMGHKTVTRKPYLKLETWCFVFGPIKNNCHDKRTNSSKSKQVQMDIKYFV